MIIEFFLTLGLILPGLCLLELAKIRVRSIFKKIAFSYISSIAIMFSLLYLGGIFNAFNLASFGVLAITIISVICLIVLAVKRGYPTRIKTLLFSKIDRDILIITIPIIALLFFYAVFLLDSYQAKFI